MKFREVWEQHLMETFRSEPRIDGALRRQCWDRDIAVMMQAGVLVIVLRTDMSPVFALPWGATAEDLVADDWEHVP